MSEAFQFSFGRLESYDEKDALYPMELVLAPESVLLPPHRHWYVPRVFQQGDSSSCVGQSWRAELEGSPHPLKESEGPDALSIYAEAQKIDPWAGEEPRIKGTTVRAAAKVLQDLGYIAHYYWASNAETARKFVLSQGPVVIGVRWREKMMTPDPGKPLVVKGPVIGGHAVLVCGYSEVSRCFRIQNSWGRGWGTLGRSWLRYDDLEWLLTEGGECACATEKPRE